MKITKKIHNFDKVIAYFGSVINVAEVLKISRFAIYQWKKIPTGRAYQIEHLTRGKLKAKMFLTKSK